MDTPVVSSAYNKMPDSKYEYTVDTTSTDIKTNTDQKKSKKPDVVAKTVVTPDSNEIATSDLNKNVLKLAPDALPCPRQDITTTDLPFILDSIIPVQNEMKTYRFEGEQSSAGKLYISKIFIILDVWCFTLAFFFT